MIQIYLLIMTTLLSLTVADPGDCFNFPPDALKCCKILPKIKPPSEEANLCLGLFKPFTCELETCFSKKLGYAGSTEGTFDSEKLTARLKEDTSEDKELGEHIINHCVNGDISKYGKPEDCDLMKFSYCTISQTAASCRGWNLTGECGKVAAYKHCTREVANNL